MLRDYLKWMATMPKMLRQAVEATKRLTWRDWAAAAGDLVALCVALGAAQVVIVGTLLVVDFVLASPVVLTRPTATLVLTLSMTLGGVAMAVYVPFCVVRTVWHWWEGVCGLLPRDS